MENGLRMMGETLSEGFAIGRLKTDHQTGSSSVWFDYINPVLNKWLGVPESLFLRLEGMEVLSQGDMSELYQISELQEAVRTDTPMAYKVFCMKMESFLDVISWKTGPDQFAMVVKKLGAEFRENQSPYSVDRINRFQVEAGLKFLINHMTDVLWRLDEDFRFTYVSASDKIMRGYECEDVLGRPLWEFITPDSVDVLRKYHQEVIGMSSQLQANLQWAKEIQMICKDGRMIWVGVHLTPVMNSKMELDGFQGVARDITEQRDIQSSLLEYRYLMEAVLDNMAQAMVVINSRMEIAAYNKKFLELFGFEAPEIIVGTPFEDIYKDWQRRRQTNRESMELDIGVVNFCRSYTREYWQMDEKREKIWVQMFHNPLPSGGFVRTYSDITDRKRYELDLYASREKLAVIAATDELTGVMNRRSGFAMLRELEKSCLKERRTFSLCFIDVDDLKGVNDNHGHGEGDIVLKTIADLIRNSIRGGDIICRIGGDEFMVLFPGCEKNVAEKLICRIRKSLAETAESMGKNYQMSFSYGVEQMSAEDPITLEELIRRADHLMYRVKRPTEGFCGDLG